MSDKKTNLKDAILDLAKGLELVFRRYTKQTREKAWDKLTSVAGEREVKKILIDPMRQVSPFGRLANQKESNENNSSLRVWVDDERPMPSEFNHHVRTAKEAIDLLRSGKVSAISLDHDLGEDSNGTGYDVAKFIEESAFQGAIFPLDISVHSANPVGVKNIKRCINNTRRFWGLE